ncbi:Haloacid dehalogenase-like hydrolase domain-containing protein 3 [Planktothrix tepida]|uniref:HAD-superfamily hydrolase, subfamily IA, variant 1 n=1 Tax=Planktothrix tepida PCC 9214 TaxID=671072 RepID=A0A1J1LSA4_9CYAN|nr:HAD family hydrolase [Planktothrix tepida]CAD5969758.1 Haloacid dehalogenase-like hydrolase domain-containing protein 3 [Planktothrix tepida]CUR35279.1 HAD-superfamily hydrolase, subfamily IA, variant 1 [Planktothrix tepida PCC 9214]
MINLEHSAPEKPRVIFLDAVGTLFGVRHSVGEAYRIIADEFGVKAEAEILDQVFFQCFLASPSMAFPGAEPGEIPQLEFEWWKAIAEQTFKTVGLYDNFTDFSVFFQALYSYFETEKPWFVYADVPPQLKYWQEQGIELGVLSNFDSRLYPVLEALNLADFFKSVTISTEAGAAKPSSQIFQIALNKHDCSPEEAWHIGDSLKADYQGAKALGIRGILVHREEPPNGILDEYESLEQIPIS